jgi:adenylate cyclase
VQEQVPVVDGHAPSDRAIRFRIGINVGDVIPDGTDVHGDVVNVAARLQAECSPGGICVSRAVRDHMHGRLDTAFEALGSLNLKNIARPVEAFMLRAATAVSALPSVERSLMHGAETLPLPDKPSIAVLPFANLSADPEQEYFSDGVADDIITELSRSRSLFVIARNSSFTYKGKAVDTKLVARELGVHYVLEGSVRRSGDRVRVVAQLIDAKTRNHIWAERYDRALQDVFDVQDEIATAVVTAIVPAVTDAELRRILRKQPGSLGAWEAYQRGLWHVARASPTDAHQAQEFFERALAVDPTFAPAYATLAQEIFSQGARYGTRPTRDAFRAAGHFARKAVELDPTDAGAQATLARVLFTQENLRNCWEHITLALSIDPNSAWANNVKGGVLVLSGAPTPGRASLLTAMRLDPRSPYNVTCMVEITVSYYFERNYPGAEEAGRSTIACYPNDPRSYTLLAAALGQLKRTDEAQVALSQAIGTSATSFDLLVRCRPAWFRPEDHEHMLEGLRKAGWEG